MSRFLYSKDLTKKWSSTHE